jgi:hypothetical protein
VTAAKPLRPGGSFRRSAAERVGTYRDEADPRRPGGRPGRAQHDGAPVSARPDRPATAHGRGVAARVGRAAYARAHPPRRAHARRRLDRPHLARRPPGATPPPWWSLAAALRHGAGQPSGDAGAWTQVRARRGTGNRGRRDDQLHRVAARGLLVVVAPHGRDDRLHRAGRRLDRDRWRAVGPPGRQLPRGSGEIPSLQHLDVADPDCRVLICYLALYV